MARCEAEIAAERIQKNNTITEKDILEIEVIRSRCSASCSHLNKVLNIHLVRKKRQQDEKNNPSTQEQDKKAAKSKRWWFNRFWSNLF